jgi:predicted ATP-grasp superfamily ATP-dependent carboligase
MLFLHGLTSYPISRRNAVKSSISQHALLLARSAHVGSKVMYCLSMAGWKVSIASADTPSPLRWSRHVTGTLNISTFDGIAHDTHSAAINDYCKTAGVSVILADVIPTAGLLHDLRPHIHTPSYAPEPLERLTQIHDKWRFYTVLKTDFRMPRTALITSLSDLDEATVDWVGRPFLLKPLNGEAGRGIRYFETCSDAISDQATSRNYRALPLIIQQYIDGENFGYSVLAKNGHALADDVQYWGSDDVRTFCRNEEVTSLCRSVIMKLNYSGPAFIDLRKDKNDGQYYPLECNCRFWSTMTANAWMGMNYADLAARATLGEELRFGPPQLSTYHLPGAILGYVKRPRNFLKVSRRNWQGFFQVVSDPLPHLPDQANWISDRWLRAIYRSVLKGPRILWAQFARVLKFGRITRSLKVRGFKDTVKLVLLQPHFLWRERRFNATRLSAQARFDREHSVDTGGVIYLGDLHIPSENSAEGTRYGPTSQSTFREMIGRVSIDYERFTFIDIGSGKGAVLLYASDYPFEKIIGVEFSPDLHEYAKRNILSYRSRSQRCFNIEAICGDATDYHLPINPLVLFLSAPFGLPIMKRFLDHILWSYRLHAREGYLIFNHVGYLPDVDAFLAEAGGLDLLSDQQTYRIFGISCGSGALNHGNWSTPAASPGS